MDEDPWKTDEYLKYHQKIVEEMDGRTVRLGCRGAKLITGPVDNRLAGMADEVVHNEALMRNLTGGGWDTFEPFVKILKDSSGVAFNSCITALSSIGKPPVVLPVVTGPNPPPPVIPPGGSIPGFYAKIDQQQLVADLNPLLSDNDKRTLAREIVKKVGLDINIAARYVTQYVTDPGNEITSHPQDERNIDGCFKFLVQNSGEEVTLQDLYNLLVIVAPGQRRQIEAALNRKAANP